MKENKVFRSYPVRIYCPGVFLIEDERQMRRALVFIGDTDKYPESQEIEVIGRVRMENQGRYRNPRPVIDAVEIEAAR